MKAAKAKPRVLLITDEEIANGNRLRPPIGHWLRIPTCRVYFRIFNARLRSK